MEENLFATFSDFMLLRRGETVRWRRVLVLNHALGGRSASEATRRVLVRVIPTTNDLLRLSAS